MNLISKDVVYRVNENDQIVFANDHWNDFADAAGSESIKFAKVVHRSLWDFIADDTTREIYRLILESARQERAVEFDFRCDSASVKRLLRMRIAKKAEGIVEFRTRVKQAQVVPERKLLDPLIPRNGEMISMCSWCTRIRVGSGWLDLDHAITVQGYFQETVLPFITHGMCDDCFTSVSEVVVG